MVLKKNLEKIDDIDDTMNCVKFQVKDDLRKEKRHDKHEYKLKEERWTSVKEFSSTIFLLLCSSIFIFGLLLLFNWQTFFCQSTTNEKV